MINIRELLAKTEETRKILNIKKSVLCKMAGIPYIQYWRWINGKAKPSGDNILKLITTLTKLKGEVDARNLAKFRKPRKRK